MLAKKLQVLIIVGASLISARIALPYFLKHYAENQINEIPKYHASISDVDVHLWRGSYTIKNIVLNQINNKIPVAFFSAERINLSVQWSALFHGAIVAKIDAFKPKLNFVIEPNKQNEQLTIDNKWQQVVKALFPLNFNKISLNQGEITLQSFTGKPPFEMSLHDIDFQIVNMQKVTGSDKLYSSFTGQGKINQGDFTVNGQVDPYAPKPTFLLKSALKTMKIEGANDFLLYFAKFDVQKGRLSLFSELAAAKGKIHGYIKPIVKNLKIAKPEKKFNPVKVVYEGVIAVTAKILTNPKKHTIATKINIDGDIENPNTHLFSIIGYLFRNAFIQALLPQIDHTVELQDIKLGSKD